MQPDFSRIQIRKTIGLIRWIRLGETPQKFMTTNKNYVESQVGLTWDPQLLLVSALSNQFTIFYRICEEQ